MANYNDRWNEENRWAGEADSSQQRDEREGYREGRYAQTGRYDEPRSYGDRGDRHRSHPLRGAPRVNQDIGYGSGSLATGVGAATRAPGSFSDYGASSSGGYGDGYGAYGGPSDHSLPEQRTYGAEPRYQRGGYRAIDRRDDNFAGNSAFATDDILDRQARGESNGGLFGRRHHEGEHRGRGPKNYSRSDERIRDDVNDRLTDDSWLDAQDITVEVDKREVTLTGHVRSRDDKRRAENLAETVSGVDHVQNNLRVKKGEADNADLTVYPAV